MKSFLWYWWDNIKTFFVGYNLKECTENQYIYGMLKEYLESKIFYENLFENFFISQFRKEMEGDENGDAKKQ